MKKYALLSVSDKTGLIKFAKELRNLGFELIGSLNTSQLLQEDNIEITEVSKITNYPAIMGEQGIKLIHPIIFGGILADKNMESHLRDCEKYNVNPFEIVVCNFYPFEKTINQENFKHDDAIFNLDIGGPAMVRCAAKNYKNVSVIVDINDYAPFINELKSGGISLNTRKKLSLKAFEYTQKYNQAIIDYFTRVF